MARLMIYIFASATALVCLGSYLQRIDCIVLPNGYMIGHASIIPLYRRFFFENALWNAESELVARTSHMVRFERHPTDPDLVVMSYPGGQTTMNGTIVMPVIYDEKTFGRWNHTPLGATIGYIGLELVYERLQDDDRFKHRFCQPPLLSFHPVD